ncbi:MAG: hypothetical protein SGPRY_002052, partial [Prymnesium sp.]
MYGDQSVSSATKLSDRACSDGNSGDVNEAALQTAREVLSEPGEAGTVETNGESGREKARDDKRAAMEEGYLLGLAEGRDAAMLEIREKCAMETLELEKAQAELKVEQGKLKEQLEAAQGHDILEQQLIQAKLHIAELDYEVEKYRLQFLQLQKQNEPEDSIQNRN